MSGKNNSKPQNPPKISLFTKISLYSMILESFGSFAICLMSPLQVLLLYREKHLERSRKCRIFKCFGGIRIICREALGAGRGLYFQAVGTLSAARSQGLT